MDIPSIPKYIVININILAVVAIFVLTSVVAIAILVPEMAASDLPPGELVMEFSYLKNPTAGQEWEINATANNGSPNTLKNIEVEIVSDSRIEGDSLVIEAILPKTTRVYFLRPVVKANAPPGDHTIKTIVTVPGYGPSEKMLEITIKPPKAG